MKDKAVGLTYAFQSGIRNCFNLLKKNVKICNIRTYFDDLTNEKQTYF